jgi:hypothetical protein
MRNLAFADFRVGGRYDADLNGIAQPLELIAAEPLAGSDREGGAFRLEFRGPFEPILEQATYSLRGPDGESDDIFLVPIGREREGTRYEAVFF